MRIFQFRCDGCDKKTTVEKEGALPLYWEFVGGEYDLCAECVSYYNQIHNPRNWPRHVKEPIS